MRSLGSERFPAGRRGNPLRSTLIWKPPDRRAWQTAVHRACKKGVRHEAERQKHTHMLHQMGPHLCFSASGPSSDSVTSWEKGIIGRSPALPLTFSSRGFFLCTTGSWCLGPRSRFCFQYYFHRGAERIPRCTRLPPWPAEPAVGQGSALWSLEERKGHLC